MLWTKRRGISKVPQFPSFAQLANAQAIDVLYASWRRDPASVDTSWGYFFEGVDAANFFQRSQEARGSLDLIQAYRRYGHLLARVNPLAEPPSEVAELALQQFGLSDLEAPVATHGVLPTPEAPLRELIAALRAIYCGTTGFECADLNNAALEAWLRERIESPASPLAPAEKELILTGLTRCELFESFLQTKYVGQKRFSLEGCETLIPMLLSLIEHGASQGVEEVILGMAHRGRLNVLANILGKPYSAIFQEFEDKFLPMQFEGSGDVKYHKGFSAAMKTSLGRDVSLHLAANSSCLEAVDPVALGLARARQTLLGDTKRQRVGAVLIHGDASIAGQGVVYESLQFMRLEGYSTGGTVHIVVNNQVGFTTPPSEGRSTRYCTDIAKTFGCPVFHVNVEDPESCVRAVKLALECRLAFQCDVFIDLNGYRKYGHNEGDEPMFTQPVDYQKIRAKRSIREQYVGQSLESDEAFKLILSEQLERARKEEAHSAEERYGKAHVVQPQGNLLERFDSAVPAATLRDVASAYATVPEGFELHPKLRKLAEDRLKSLDGGAVDWGTAEMLAFGSLLLAKRRIRLAGQDSKRGTFSQRHAVWFDQRSDAPYVPLAKLGNFEVLNSPLSEFACMGFEYGYSWANLDALLLWEAQYGDFAIGAQTVIDHYITTAEEKWARVSSLVLLLPHGYEGQGPEHSSGRIERYLQLAARNNTQIVNPTTPAQYFHVLRRQALRAQKKPLIVFTPKSLLRAPACVSTLADFTSGAFQEVLDDPVAKNPKRVVLCSGKIFYELLERRGSRTDIALIRLEQLYPLHTQRLGEILARSKCQDICWVQEEPQNMGAWEFLQGAWPQKLRYIGRARSAVTATGSHKQHTLELERIMEEVFA